MTIEELYDIIQQRKKNLPADSYVVKLLQEGDTKILAKIEEEADEVIHAAKKETRERLISEVADLCFHVLILLSAHEITPDEVLKELESRKKP